MPSLKPELNTCRPTKEPKARPERKPLPEHLQREVVTHAPSRDCCAGLRRPVAAVR